MRSRHIAIGLFFIAVCMGIGLLMAISERSSSVEVAAVNGAGAAANQLSEEELIDANIEPPITDRAEAASATAPPVVEVPQVGVLEASFTPGERRLIEESSELEARCRGGDGENTEAACEQRAAAMDRLNAAGICWGREDEPYAAYQYHRCGPGSIR